MNRNRDSDALQLIAAPLPALVVGVFVMATADVSPTVWIQNLAAAVIGAGAAAAVIWGGYHWPHRQARRWVIPVGAIGLLATLLTAGIDGVHRWVSVGPFRLHVAAVVLPAMLVVFRELPFRASAFLAVLIVSILFSQPDFAQAGAFAIAWSVLVLYEHGARAVIGAVAVLGIASATWPRPDSLEPVAHVEDIVRLAFSQGTLLGLLSIVALSAIPAVLVRVADRAQGLALATFFAATMLAAWLGHFPVPILGYGMSPIFGFYLGVMTLWIFADRHMGPPSGVPGALFTPSDARQTVHNSTDSPDRPCQTELHCVPERRSLLAQSSTSRLVVPKTLGSKTA